MKLSIITINYNNADGLKKTIQSVMSQRYTDFEYVIVDGASTDGSVGVIHAQVQKLEGLKVRWISEPDTGIYNAMNKGLAMATGEYCLFLNSGDYLAAENTLEKVFAEEFVADIVYGKIKEITKENSYIINYPSPEKCDFLYFSKNSLPHGASFIRREAFEKVGLYNENNKIVSDWEWYLLAVNKYNLSLRQIDVLVSHFDGTGISSQDGNKQLIKAEIDRAISKHFPLAVPILKQLHKVESDISLIKSSVTYRILRKLCKIAPVKTKYDNI